VDLHRAIASTITLMMPMMKMIQNTLGIEKLRKIVEITNEITREKWDFKLSLRGSG
jgi:hypothetical protein